MPKEGKNAKRKKKRQLLLDALEPFLNVPVTEEGDVWLYVGKADEQGGVKMKDGTILPSHLHTDDFVRLREAL